MHFIADVGFHLCLEALGAGALVCVTGVCSHKHKVPVHVRRIMIGAVWVLMSVITVMLVG